MDLLTQLRQKIKDLAEQRASTETELDAVIAGAEAEERTDLNADETAKFAEIRKALSDLDTKLEELEGREAELVDEAERRQKAAEARRRVGDNGDPAKVVIRAEERTYRSGGPHSFFADAYRAVKMGDFAAQARLQRHDQEVRAEGEVEQRDVGTSSFGGLVVPQFLVEEFAAVLRNGRAYANAVRRLPLPDEGMALKIPRGQTGSSTTEQATENAAASETNVDFDNDLSIDVRTISGQQDVSRQSLERGTPGIDRLVFADLVADYAETLDVQIIKDDGTSGKHKGVLSATGIDTVTYTDASPTVAEVWPKIADAIQAVATARKLGANLIVMHPRRWGWFTAGLDSQNRPLIVADPSAAVNAMGKQAAEAFGEGQLVGTVQGLPVLADANVPTNLGTGTDEDRIIVVRRQDQILWEVGDGMPRELRFEETLGGNLTVKLVVYGYSAFTAERYPEAVSVISGTGLIAPTF